MVVSVVVIIDHQLHSSITDQTTHDLAGEARLVALQWESATNADSLADAAGVATGHRITLIDSAGHVIGDSDFDGPALQEISHGEFLQRKSLAADLGVGKHQKLIGDLQAAPFARQLCDDGRQHSGGTGSLFPR
jgi:hypothetical protein